MWVCVECVGEWECVVCGNHTCFSLWIGIRNKFSWWWSTFWQRHLHSQRSVDYCVICSAMQFNFSLWFAESRFYPEQLLVSMENGNMVLGEMPDINQPLSISGGGPIVVDAIGRNVYWYSRSDNLIYNQSLTSGSLNVCSFVCVCVLCVCVYVHAAWCMYA